MENITLKASISKSRYYLHQKVKENCRQVKLCVRERTIYVRHDQIFPVDKSPHIKKLMLMGYIVQIEI